MKPGPILTTLSPASKARSSGAQKIPLRELENSEDWRDEAGGNDARRVPMPSVFARSALADGQALWSGGVPNRRRSRYRSSWTSSPPPSFSGRSGCSQAEVPPIGEAWPHEPKGCRMTIPEWSPTCCVLVATRSERDGSASPECSAQPTIFDGQPPESRIWTFGVLARLISPGRVAEPRQV